MFFRETHSGKIKEEDIWQNRDRGSFMGALTWIVMSMANGEFLRLAATVVTGVVSYFALCIMLRNPVCMEYKQTLLRRENNDLRIMSGGCKDRRNRTSASACKDPDGCEKFLQELFILRYQKNILA